MFGGGTATMSHVSSHHRKKGSMTGPIAGIHTSEDKAWNDYRATNFNHTGAVSSKHSRRSDASRSSVGNISQRSRSIKEAGNMILNSNNLGSVGASRDDDYWNKIILHNLDQFNREKEEAKFRTKENQIRMKEELEKQMQA